MVPQRACAFVIFQVCCTSYEEQSRTGNSNILAQRVCTEKCNVSLNRGFVRSSETMEAFVFHILLFRTVTFSVLQDREAAEKAASALGSRVQ